MIKQLVILLFFFLLIQVQSQTTDLSINIEAQNLSGSAVSQIDIYEDFQYLITISNSGNTVSNASILIDLDVDLTINNVASQNNTNGASIISDINNTDNVLTGNIENLPNNSSVELLILVTAPTTLGGIAANAIVSPPDGTTDTNTSNNQSIISIDVLDIIIDFTVSHVQIQPSEGTAISAWGDEVTYQFTITNNSAIDFPIDAIEGNISLNTPDDNGQPFTEIISINCIETNSSVNCPDLTSTVENVVVVQSFNSTLFYFNEEIEFESLGYITFEIVYRYTNFSCSENQNNIIVNSEIEIELDHENESPNVSNLVETILPVAELCPLTDICIETIQTNPDVSQDLEYNEEITFITTVCNASNTATPIRFFFQNLSEENIIWDINSVTCLNTSGNVECDDFSISIFPNGQIWASDDFILEGNTSITIETILQYLEPQCVEEPSPIEAIARSAINILDNQIIDINLDNNIHFNFSQLPEPDPENCKSPSLSGLLITKEQISPELPIGISDTNTSEWGFVTYEVTVKNLSEFDGVLVLKDRPSSNVDSFAPITGTLISAECISATGNASCFEIQNLNLGVPLDGQPENGNQDIFWEILPEDNWILPGNSSVTFQVVIDWLPECSIELPMVGTNIASAGYANGPDNEAGAMISADVTTFFAPCVDLVVQTYPSSPQVETGETFDWIVDINNSITSSTAVDIQLENILNSSFIIEGDPICTVSAGNATCIISFDLNNNTITGIIPFMDPESTVTITIPVSAPNSGGAFNNIAQAFPSSSNNEEITPETNISINSVQVISPELDKFFIPETIYEGGESELFFTVFNIASNPTQNNIAFKDNLPNGVVLSGIPNWVEANGCTAIFSGNIGDNSVGISDLVFPDGVESCTFSVMVTSDIEGSYLNNFLNFSNTNNIDTSQTSATLNVIIDTSNVDITITKTVDPFEAVLGDQVIFTITASNIGTSEGTNIEILDALPPGYEFISAESNIGAFDESTLLWNIPNLMPNESAILNITVRVISSINLLNVASLFGLTEIDRDSSNNEDSASIEISNCLQIPEGISPNSDGRNDVLVIPCIEDFAENSIKIYNRYGTQVYQANNYVNTWNGTSNMGFPNSTELLPVGTYFYILQIRETNTTYQGYIYLNY